MIFQNYQPSIHAWLYGADRAASILKGEDKATQADVRAWRNLGHST